MEWKEYILKNGIDDLFVSGYIQKNGENNEFIPSYYDLYIKSKDKLIKFSTDYPARINVSFAQKILPLSYMDEDDFFCFSSIYKIVFKDEIEISIYEISLNKKDINDEIIFVYKDKDAEKRLLRFDPLTIFGFSIYNEKYEDFSTLSE